MVKIKICIGLVLALFIIDTVQASDWDYEDTQRWASLEQHYASCSGLNQSPINITDTVKASLPALKFDHQASANSMINNGHTLQVDFSEGAALMLEDQKFELKQFHLHSPSENQIRGTSYPLELHLVHVNDKGALAVVALMFSLGERHTALERILTNLPKEQGQGITLEDKDLLAELLPKQLDYYRYNGSLTTPPCTEGVRWVVLKDIQQVSASQLEQITRMLKTSNNRPIQPIGARVILE